MIWDIVQAKIEATGLASVAQGNLFLDEMPATLKVGVMMRSPLAGVRIDANLPDYYRPTLQVVVRHTDPEQGAIMAQAIMQALTIVAEESYPATDKHGAVMLKVFQPRELPIRYPTQAGGTIEFSLNFVTAFTMAL